MNVRRSKKAHFIKEWREHSGLSLRRLADRLVDIETGDALVSDASLSRIERGIQPYSQPLLEALAAAFGCSPADLLMRNPTDPEAPWTIWETLKPSERHQAVEIIKTIKRVSEAA